MTTIGFATIGQTPRTDVVPAVLARLGGNVRAAERGCLDGLSRAEIDALAPEPGEVGIITLLQDGSSVLLSHGKLLPRMQRCVDELEAKEHVALTVILCGADWSAIASERLVINPGTVFPAVVSAIARDRRLGIIKPSAGQIEKERARYAELGIDAVVTSASPYAGADRLTQAASAARLIDAAGCDLTWMTCVGMDRAMRDTVASVTGHPVLLAQDVIAGIVSPLLPQPREVRAAD